MIRNLVVPLDGSGHSWSATQHAIHIARCHRATIHGISVTDVKVIEGQLLDALQVDSAEVQSHYQDQGRMLLDQLEMKCREAGVAFRPLLTAGVVPGVICKVASETEAELVVMGKRGSSAQWSGPLLGSTTETVVRLAKRPVLLVQEQYRPVTRVYVAYDGALISVRALRFMADLCKGCQWPLSAISVHRSPERREKLLSEAARIADLHSLPIDLLDRPGDDAMQQILDSTKSDPDALIALGARSRRLLGLTLGSTVERVMRRAPQPVLIYRPLPS